MKLTLDKDDLLAALARVTRVVEKRNTIPILTNVKLGARGDRLIITGTDLDIQVTTSAPAQVAQAGETTLPAGMLHDVVKKLAAGTVTLEEAPDGGKAQVRAGRSRFTLNSLPVADFPDLSAGELPHAFSLTPGALSEMIARVAFAISTEETRYYLNGIYLHAVSDEGAMMLRAVATDGHRLALHQAPLPEGAIAMPGILLPRKTVDHLARLLDAKAEDPVRLEVSPTKVRATIGTTTLTSKLIDGTFPDYGRVIPQANDKVAALAKDDLAAAADRVATVSSERTRAVKFAFSAGALLLSVTDPEAGAASDEMEIDYAAEPLEIGFNAAYVRDILAAVPGARVRLSLADAGSPCLIQPEDGTAALFVLMPMRV